MDWWQAALLGLIQGVTEFIPVSSSGHLRVVEQLTGLKEPQTQFDVALHVATLLAIVVFFRKDLWEIACAPFRVVHQMVSSHSLAPAREDAGFRGALLIAVGSVPTAFIGYYAGPFLEGLSVSLIFVALMFIVNAMILFASRAVVFPFAPARLNTGFHGMRFLDALLVGTVQGLSVTRGISRSGSTISVGIMSGVDRETAGRFSFLLSIPAIGGAAVFAMHGSRGVPAPPGGLLLLGAGLAFVSGNTVDVQGFGRLHHAVC